MVLEIFKDAIDKLKLAMTNEQPIETFKINCQDIPRYDQFDFNSRHTGKLGELFRKLDEIRTPVLYWFECIDTESSMKLKTQHAKFRDSRGRNHDRHAPAKNRMMDSKILYVGMRQGGYRKKDGFTNIAGRIYIHLGYYSQERTQGLQLVHWCKESIDLNIMPLDNGVSPFLGGLEKMLAKELRPVIGRH